MNDMEKRKFEDSFQEAFKNAEVNPSDNVWTNIELDLEKAEGDKMKRRLFFFKMLAAASVVFAMSIAGIGYYVFQHNDAGNLAQQTTNPGEVSDADKALQGDSVVPDANGALDDVASEKASKNNSSQPKTTDSERALLNNSTPARALNEKATTPASELQKDIQDSSGEKAVEELHQEKGKGTSPLLAADKKPEEVNALDRASSNSSTLTLKKDVNAQTINGITLNSNPSTLTPIDKDASTAANNTATTRKLPLLYQPAAPELRFPVSTADPGMLLLAKLAEEEKKYATEEERKTKNKAENLWTAVGFAAGGFNANNPSVAPVASNSMYSMNSASTASKQSKASGLAYSIGVSVGTKLSDRWVLQGGVNYLTQTYDYTANSVVVVNNNFEAPKAESINAFAPQLSDATADTKVAQTFPYNVNNNVRFMSVPVQAGYLVVNRKFGLQLNAGISTDLFLQNTITPDGGGLTRTTQGRGDESPYRPLNFSGLMGTEFSYKLGNHYRLSLNPGLRYPFSSVYKSNTGVDSTPLTFDLGLRFRYIFH